MFLDFNYGESLSVGWILSGSVKEAKEQQQQYKEEEDDEVNEQKTHTVWMPNWANNVGDFIPNFTSPFAASHSQCPSILCYFCCYVEIKFDEFFKRNFFNYQINAVEYFSKHALRKKNAKTILQDQQWLRRRHEEW